MESVRTEGKHRPPAPREPKGTIPFSFFVLQPHKIVPALGATFPTLHLHYQTPRVCKFSTAQLDSRFTYLFHSNSNVKTVKCKSCGFPDSSPQLCLLQPQPPPPFTMSEVATPEGMSYYCSTPSSRPQLPLAAVHLIPTLSARPV